MVTMYYRGYTASLMRDKPEIAIVTAANDREVLYQGTMADCRRWIEEQTEEE